MKKRILKQLKYYWWLADMPRGKQAKTKILLKIECGLN